MRKTVIGTLVLLLMLCMLLCGCSGGSEAENGDKYEIVCTNFAAYDWVKVLTDGDDDHFNVRFLLENGEDIHNYQPTTEDFAAISECDVFIYCGGVSDTWVEDALEQTDNSDMVVINLMEVDGLTLLEADGHECKEEHGHEHEHEYDEHIWLSFDNAKLCVGEIYSKLAVLDPEHADMFEGNYTEYTGKIDRLDADYTEMIESAGNTEILVADRFPFIYLTHEYGITYHAAFPGCSAETEASFDTLVTLIHVLCDDQLPAVIVMENSDGDVAETIVNESGMDGVEILTLNSMQSVSDKEMDEGVTYLSVMEDNYDVLERALN